VADAPQARTTFPANSETRTGETETHVNVYDNSPTGTTTPSLERRTTYPEPVTRSSPSLVTWLIILVLVVLALYFVMQFLT